jgi:hypothetical protein
VGRLRQKGISSRRAAAGERAQGFRVKAPLVRKQQQQQQQQQQKGQTYGQATVALEGAEDGVNLLLAATDG